MKVKLKHFTHSDNGLSLQLCPETMEEVELLRAFFHHGELSTGHPCGEMGDTGFYVKWKPAHVSS